ncbi:MAG: DUF2273 domain-containing protein [Bacillota bacterium]|nr:DUF2273 domain-containing protein [Bacillota bacterium]
MSELNWWVVLSKHWGKILGGLLGLFFALLVIKYGFWSSVFIFFCIGVGLLIGWRIKDISRFFKRLFSSKDEY